MTFTEFLEKWGKTVFEGPVSTAQAAAPEFPEIRLAVLEEVRRKSYSAGARKVFPFDLIRVSLRGVEQSRVERLELVGRERPAEEIARLRFDGFEARRGIGGPAQRGNCRHIIICGDNARALRKPQRKRSYTTEQIGDLSGPKAMRFDQLGESSLAGSGCLKKSARRQHDLRAAYPHHGQGLLCGNLAVTREAREAIARRNLRQLLQAQRRQRP